MKKIGLFLLSIILSVGINTQVNAAEQAFYMPTLNELGEEIYYKDCNFQSPFNGTIEKPNGGFYGDNLVIVNGKVAETRWKSNEKYYDAKVDHKYVMKIEKNIYYIRYTSTIKDKKTNTTLLTRSGNWLKASNNVVPIGYRYYYFDNAGKKTLANGWYDICYNSDQSLKLKIGTCTKTYYKKGIEKYYQNSQNLVYSRNSEFDPNIPACSAGTSIYNLTTTWIDNIRYIKGEKKYYKDENGIIKKLENGKETNTTVSGWIGIEFYKEGKMYASYYNPTTKKQSSTGKAYISDSNGNATNKLVDKEWLNKKYFINGVFTAEVSSDNKNIYVVKNNKATNEIYNYSGKVGTKNYENGKLTANTKNSNFPTSIQTNKTSIALTVGESSKITATVNPSTATNKTVKWTSNNTKIATVDQNGNIIAQGTGKTTIKASTSNGKVAKVTVTVKKTAIFFGDSITWGYNAYPKPTNTVYSWVDYINNNYDIKGTNSGAGGWTISATDKRKEKAIFTLIDKYKNQKFDYVILQGGCNDIAFNRPIGTYTSNDFSGNYDYTTVSGGLETYIYLAKKTWPNAKIGFIVTYQTPNDPDRRTEKSKKYYDQMKRILKKWNIKYIDLFDSKTGGKHYSKDILKTQYTYSNGGLLSPDNIHLSEKGYNTISPYIYKWMRLLK